MSDEHFATTNRRIEEERRSKYCGTVSLRIASVSRQVSSATNNVDAIRRMFRQERGCRKEDGRHHARALVSRQALEEATKRAGISTAKLLADDLPYAELEFPPNTVLCIEGHDRLGAADKVLRGSMKRWIFDLYLDDLSNDLRLLLSDGYEYQKKPDSGEYYLTIRRFQGWHGEKNPFFENIWLARLATNKNSRRLFDQLSRHREYSAAFDKLLAIPALFAGFRLGSIHQLLGMKLERPNLQYLKRVYECWAIEICKGNNETMRQLSRDDIKMLEGRAPGACRADRAMLGPQAEGGKLFSNFNFAQRGELWTAVCAASKLCLIPTLHTFFEDRKYICDANHSLRRILDVRRHESVDDALVTMFSKGNQSAEKCVIQSSETRFGSMPGDEDAQLTFGIRQMWLAAFRNYKELPAVTQKQGVLALARSKTADSALHSLASLASHLGFSSDKLNEILQKSPDRYIAENALFEARGPGQYRFPDQEGCVQKIIETFETAIPLTGEVTDDGQTRQLDQPVRRYGHPHEIDHEYDKAHLFLPQIQDGLHSDLGEMTSIFVRWSVYCTYFGLPPACTNYSPTQRRDTMDMTDNVPLSDDPYFAATRQNPEDLHEEQPDIDEQIIGKEQRLNDLNDQIKQMEAQFNSLQQNYQSKNENLQSIQENVQFANTKLGNLQQQYNTEEESLRLKYATSEKLLQSQLDTLNDQVHSKNRELAALHQKLFESQEASNDKVKEVEALSNKLTEQTRKLQELEVRCALKQRQISELDGKKKPILKRAMDGTGKSATLSERSQDKQKTTGLEAAVIASALPPITERRHTQFDLVGKGSSNDVSETPAGGDAEMGDTVVIKFTDEDGNKKVSLKVHGEEGVRQVQAQARKYLQQKLYLFDQEANQLNPTDCYQKVVDDGTYTITVRHLQSNVGTRGSNRVMRRDRDEDRETMDKDYRERSPTI